MAVQTIISSGIEPLLADHAWQTCNTRGCRALFHSFYQLNYFAIKLKVRVCSTPSPVLQGSQLRALGAGPLSRFACHVLKALTEGSPRMGVVRPSRALRTKSPMPQIYGPVWAAPVKLEAPQPDSPSGNAVPASPYLHSEAAKLLHNSIARNGA